MSEEKNWDEETRDHVNRVAFLCGVFCRELCKRAAHHDTSKFTPDEAPAFKASTPELRKQTFMGAEYRKSLRTGLNKALRHHYLHNRHHPQHFDKIGMSGMNLVDLVEMILDWIAASERHDDGDPLQSVIKQTGRFHIPPMLASILSNTVVEMKEVEHVQEEETHNLLEEESSLQDFRKGWGSVDQGTGGNAGVRGGSGEEDDA